MTIPRQNTAFAHYQRARQNLTINERDSITNYSVGMTLNDKR